MKRNPPWTRDEIILASELYLRHDGQVLGPQHPEVLELSELLNSLPIHSEQLRRDKFRNPNGIGLKLSNIRYCDPARTGGSSNVSRLDGLVWDEFDGDMSRLLQTANAIRQSYALRETATNSIEEAESGYDPPEGRLLMRLHRTREHNASTVAKKIASVLHAKGTLKCEICGFDFEKLYGKLGTGFIECHHNVLLHKLKPIARTSLNELSVVCANCHRMLHRDGVKTVNQLLAMIEPQ
jgi:5-methylcytosine-specific restriction protein A